MIDYSLQQLKTDMSAMQPRFFDLYLLPGFMCWYAYKSTSMKRLARRVLFTAGIYMAMRNYAKYEETVKLIVSKARETTV